MAKKKIRDFGPESDLVRKINQDKSFRFGQIEVKRARAEGEEDSIRMSFSSETPVRRWFGYEILDHSKKAVDLSRLLNRGPFLKDHDTRLHVGALDDVAIEPDKVLRGTPRFSSSEIAQQERRDILDEIRVHTSIGYLVHRMILEEEDEDGPDTYRVTEWTPLEGSTVAIAADPSVGAGRGFGNPVANEKELKALLNRKEDDMAGKKIDEPGAPVVDAEAIKAEGEREGIKVGQNKMANRAKEVMAVISQFPDLEEEALRFLENDEPISALLRLALDHRKKKKDVPTDQAQANLDLTPKEIKRWSLFNLVRHLIDKGDQSMREAAAFELECSREVGNLLDKGAKGAYIPNDVLEGKRFIPNMMNWDQNFLNRNLIQGRMDRAVEKGTFAAGGALVEAGPQGIGFIEMLRAAMMLEAAGARTLTGLVGEVEVPRQTGGATGYWVGEKQSATESEWTLGHMTATAKTVGAWSKITRKMLKQSSYDVEALVTTDQAITLATQLDMKGLHGIGAKDPLGICNTTGIGSVAMGTDGLALTYGKVVDLEAEPFLDNALTANMAFMTNPLVRREARQIVTVTSGVEGNFIWKEGMAGAVDSVLGYPAFVTNQVSNTLDKGTSTGVCSALLFANFAEALFFMWGAVDVNVDTSTFSDSGDIKLVSLLDADFAVRHPESFAAILDILTA